jgi:hypothetical protein
MAERLQRQLQRIAPSHPSLNLPFDAFLVDILEDSIREVEAAKAAAQPQQDSLTKKQQDKNYELKQRFHEKWMEWRQSFVECRKIASSKAQQIMRLLPIDWDAERITPISLSVSDVVKFSSWEQGKRANDELELQLWQLESRVAAMTAALAFENEPPTPAYALSWDMKNGGIFGCRLSRFQGKVP